MTEKKKRVPALRFPEFEGEWEEKKLGELCTFSNGINAKKEQYGHGRKFINVLDILNKNYITYNEIIGKVAVSKEVEHRNKVEYGDLLFLRSSETREEVGTSNVYLDNTFALYGGFCVRLLSDSTSQWTPLSFANSSSYQVCNGLSPSRCYPCQAHLKALQSSHMAMCL
ncbi:hypothetical protein RNS32_09420 [Staphylococcus pseudintermedius]|nr:MULTISPECIES: hypothetical protein [Staphylococcus intermedius group]MDA3111369.1 hypothetical protein [Staphylococcus pseudintermedius]MDA3118941.1 hypothetical protein [Staphylococcus pseudintermedius]MDF0186056.1 hypothetical protein [Staphylococcus pseudintermedius]MDF0269352.1 hypothetical protein [Staphylococcus pseudintermedius]MDK3630117.1 hypothetical protein [Staphylococcus pseudintermedius]